MKTVFDFDREAILERGYDYLASPYTDKSFANQFFRYNLVCKRAAELIKAGEIIFSPIAQYHPIAQHGLEKDFKSWKQINYLFLANSKRLLVYCLPGWEDSVGLLEEINWASNLNKEIKYLPYFGEETNGIKEV